jgi:hypothetical protein
LSKTSLSDMHTIFLNLPKITASWRLLNSNMKSLDHIDHYFFFPETRKHAIPTGENPQ